MRDLQKGPPPPKFLFLLLLHAFTTFIYIASTSFNYIHIYIESSIFALVDRSTIQLHSFQTLLSHPIIFCLPQPVKSTYRTGPSCHTRRIAPTSLSLHLIHSILPQHPLPRPTRLGLSSRRTPWLPSLEAPNPKAPITTFSSQTPTPKSTPTFSSQTPTPKSTPAFSSQTPIPKSSPL